MNVIQKSDAIKAGLRKGFQDGNSKMARRKCYHFEYSTLSRDIEVILKDKKDVEYTSWSE